MSEPSRTNTTQAEAPVPDHQPEGVLAIVRDWREIGKNIYLVRAKIASEVQYEISGFIECGGSADNVFVARLTFLTPRGRRLSPKVAGLSWSERAGCFFYPMRVARGGFFRILFSPPRHVAELEISFQRWQRGADRTCRVADVQVTATEEGRELVLAHQKMAAESESSRLVELEALDAGLRKLVEQKSREFLKLWNKPLFADDMPYLQSLVHTGATLSKDNLLIQQLCQRYLWAGRSSDALGITTELVSSGLKRERGRVSLLNAVRQRSRPHKPAKIRSSGLVYLLHNCLPYHSGGYASRAHGLLRGFQSVGWSVHPFARPGYPQDRGKKFNGHAIETIDDVTYNFAPDSLPFDGEHLVDYVGEFARYVLRSVDRTKVGYVQAASFFANGFAGRIVADALDVPLVYEMRGLDWFTAGSKDHRWQSSEQALMLRDLEIEAARAADHVFAITNALRGWLIEHGVAPEKISLLPNGCFTDAFEPSVPDRDLETQLGLESAFVVGYVGSIVFYEGLEVVAAAIKKARAQTGLDIRLLIVGDGPHYARLNDELRALDAFEFTTLIGRVPHNDVRRYYSIMDTIALARLDLPVCQYISPLKPFECMAMAKPMITSDVAAIREIMDASGAGLTFRANDIDHCCERIIELALSKDLQTDMALRGRQWVRQERDWGVLAKKAIHELTQNSFI